MYIRKSNKTKFKLKPKLEIEEPGDYMATAAVCGTHTNKSG